MASSLGSRQGSLETRGERGERGCGRELLVPLLPVAVPKIKKGKNLTQAVLPGELFARCRYAWAGGQNHSVRRNAWGGDECTPQQEPRFPVVAPEEGGRERPPRWAEPPLSEREVEPIPLVPTQRQSPQEPRSGSHFGECREPLPWGPGSLRLTPALECVGMRGAGQEDVREENRGAGEAHRPTGLPFQPCPTGLTLPQRGPRPFHPERKPGSRSRGKPARGGSPRKWQKKASVGKRSWKRGGNHKQVLKNRDTEEWTGHAQDGCDAVECAEDRWGRCRFRWPPRSWPAASPCRRCAPPSRTSSRHRSAAR